MEIASNTVASFHYTLFDEQGQELESSRGGDPSAYLHGANNIIRGLESAMAGHVAGDSFEVTVAPTDAYGLRNSERSQRVPVKHLLYRGKLKAGRGVQLNTSQGRQAVTVTIRSAPSSATATPSPPTASRAASTPSPAQTPSTSASSPSNSRWLPPTPP